MKLQDAYFAELNSFGTWAKIGYTAPGEKVKGASDGSYASTNFTYSGGNTPAEVTCPDNYENKAGVCTNSEDATTSAKGAKLSEGWKAKNNVQLNDCTSGDHWKISAESVEASKLTAASASYTSAALDDGCLALTPNFAAIAASSK